MNISVSRVPVTNYVDNSRVQDFGRRLKHVRESLRIKPKDMAKRALGPGSSEKRRRDFANYVSSFESNGDGNPTLELLSSYAKGLNISLAEFIARLEASQTKSDLHLSRKAGSVASSIQIPAPDGHTISAAHAEITRAVRSVVADTLVRALAHLAELSYPAESTERVAGTNPEVEPSDKSE